MTQALKLVEKFKAEVGKMPKGHAETGDESGIAFGQAQRWAQSMVCHQCGVMGQGLNQCPKLNHAQRKQFWDNLNYA